MRILVVDDHELVRRGMCAVLAANHDLEICGEAVDGRDAIEKTRSLHPDMVVMDISMPNMNGLDATREIRRFLPDTGIIIVSQHETPEMVRHAFNCGASGYVVKSAISKDLLTAIQRVSRKDSFVSSETLGANRSPDPQEILARSAAFERALRESEERFRSAMNNMAEGLYTLDSSGSVTYVNPAAESMCGWTSAELLGKPIHHLIHRRDTDRKPRSLENCSTCQILQTGKEVKEHEDVFVRKNGTRFPVLLSASPLRRDGHLTGTVVCFRDDTKRRQAEDALRRSERIYRTIGESIDYGVWICDAEGRNTYCSSSLLKLAGLSQEQFSDFGWQSILHPDEIQPTLRAWQECLRSGSLWEREMRVRTAAGGSRYVLVRGGPIRDADNKIIYWAGIALDIQHRKESEAALAGRIAERTEALQKATEQLRKLSIRLLQTQDEERRRIARELHDGIGQLLAAMSMHMASIDAEKNQLSANARQSLDEAIEMMGEASQEIRTMSHLLHPPLLDDVGLESALRWYVSGFASRSKIEISIDAPPGFSDGLPRELSLTLFRIVQESLTNVHRHSQSRTAQITIERSEREIVLEIRDQGKGISPEMQSRIASGVSLGVGLRGMQERTRQFDGELEVSSSQGETRIRALLPIELQPVSENKDCAQMPASVTAASTATESATILCVDDEESALLSRKLLLESAGHRVLEARSGPEGIQAFQTEKIDIVILDYWMSGMKGTTVAAEMKRINPSIPIIMLSGVSDLPGEGSGWVDQWLVKGTHRAEHLLDSISTMLERKLV
jgi:PAS domain S-box-containing protein